MYAPFTLDTSLYYAAVALPFGPRGGAAVSDTLLRTSGYQERNDLNQIIGENRSIMKNTAAMTYAFPVRDHLAVGVKGQFLQEKVFSSGGSALGLDMGLYGRPFAGLSWGLAVANINRPRITLADDPNIYGRDYKAGLAYHGRRDLFVVSIDVNKLDDEDVYYTAGAEINPVSLLSLRGGLNQQGQPTAGMGVNFGALKVDYAFVNQKDLGLFNRMSLTYRWGNVYQAGVRPQGLNEKTGAIPLKGLHNELRFDSAVPGFRVKRWSLAILNADKQVVRLLGEETRPPEKILWDMKDNAGQPVKSGVYSTLFRVEYGNDRVWEQKGKFKLDASAQGGGRIDVEMSGSSEPSAETPAAAPAPAAPADGAAPAPSTPSDTAAPAAAPAPAVSPATTPAPQPAPVETPAAPDPGADSGEKL
jgi:hypothetical protein